MSSQRDRRLRAARAKVAGVRKEAETEIAYYEKRDSRKQFVRRFGWLEVITAYVQGLRDAGVNRPWKYLTLPGRNSIDIGLLWKSEVIDKTSDGRLSVAICDKKYAELVISDLAKFGGLLAYSNKPLDEELDEASSALKEQFPFDVINLDLTNPLIPAKHSTNLKIIEWIFKLQKGQGFLLLLTTRPDNGARNRLLTILRQNLQHEEQFKTAYVGRYTRPDPQLCLNDYTAFTQIIFPKALARWARNRGYKTYERFAAKYRRSNQFDMICHSLEFEPLGIRIAAKRYTPRFQTTSQTSIDEMLNEELSSAVRTAANNAYAEFISTLPGRAATNIVQALASDRALERELGDESESLIGWWQ
jgi:hypothetical protein